MFELDHAFVWCRAGAPEAALLERAGLRVGRRRRHPGQGTANACFFFADAMLELIWVADEDEARSHDVQPIGLWERWRWRETGHSPVGVCVRSEGEVPFTSWEYRAPFLPEGVSLAMACNSAIVNEPLLFAVPERFQPGDAEHPLVGKRVTRATVTVKDLAPSSMLREVSFRNVAFVPGDAHRLEIELDGGAEGRALDCSPEIPLVLRW